MAPYLMDVFIDKHRILALQRLCMAYIATNVELSYVSHILAYENQE